MGLATIVRSAVEAARAATDGLQCDLAHEAWIGQDAFGAPSYSRPIWRKALVQEGVIHHKQPDGQVVTTKARLSFLARVEPTGAAGRQEPLDPRDRIALPSGLVGNVAEIPAVLVAADTGEPYLRVAWLA